MKFAILCLGLLFGVINFSYAEEPVPNGIMGTWTNQNQDTPNCHTLDIDEINGKIHAVFWLKRDGKEKKVAEIETPFSPGEAEHLSPGAKPLIFKNQLSFAIREYELSRTKKAIRLLTKTTFTDNSGRFDYESLNYYIPESLKTTPPKNEDWFGTWEFSEGLEDYPKIVISDVGDIVMHIWGIHGTAISKVTVNTITLPLEGGTQTSGKIQFDSNYGFKTVTYHLNLNGDKLKVISASDYKDPNRRDRSFEETLSRVK